MPPALHAPERRLHAVPSRSAVDLGAAEAAARSLLAALGADLGADGLLETPRRIARAYAELLTPMPFNATTFPNDEGYDELVVVRDIPFQSLCMHHMLPFHGIAHVAYLPGERIIGLSKLGRVVDLFACDLQVQERLTTQVARPDRGALAGGAADLPDGAVRRPGVLEVGVLTWAPDRRQDRQRLSVGKEVSLRRCLRAAARACRGHSRFRARKS